MDRFDIQIDPSGPLGGYLTVPPSKNYTTRFILAAALAEGSSTIRNPASNDDALALIRCCRALGARIEEVEGGLRIHGVAGRPANPSTLNPGNAGAVLRMLLGVACLCEGEVRFETSHPESLGRRPNRELLAALRQLGVEARGAGDEALLPITLLGGRARLHAGRVEMDCSRSSQFLSSILFLAPHLAGSTEIALVAPAGRSALVSAPLIDQTLDVLSRFGATVARSEGGLQYNVPRPSMLRGGDHTVPGDWPSAAALMSAVAVAGGMASLAGLEEDAQGERRSRDLLAKMGCNFTTDAPRQLYVHSKGALRAADFDGDLATDAVLALEAAACLAEGTSRFSGIANLALKESDRIRQPLAELAKIGVASRHGSDWVEIIGRPEGYEGGIEVDCLGDHRVAQMLAIVGMRCDKGLTLRGAECVSKSYPGFFDDLARLGVKLRRHPRS